MNTADRVSRLQNPQPADLRHAATIKNMVWLPVMACAGPMIADALEIADESSRALIDCSCLWTDAEDGTRWYDARGTCAHEQDALAQAVRYLEARGLLRRREGQGHMVSFLGET